MPPPRTDLHQKIRDILAHFSPLPAEAAAPLSHYSRSIADVWNLVSHVERNFGELPLQPAAVRRHTGRLYGMVLVNLVETFERYLKEVAAACVDALARYVLDDRFNAFKLQGSALAAHFNAGTVGRALCESATWLDCDEVNDRFRRLLAPPFESGNFLLFPKQPAAERERYETLGIRYHLAVAAHDCPQRRRHHAVRRDQAQAPREGRCPPDAGADADPGRHPLLEAIPR